MKRSRRVRVSRRKSEKTHEARTIFPKNGALWGAERTFMEPEAGTVAVLGRRAGEAPANWI